MNVLLFKQIATHMLQKHYGINLTETHFVQDTVVQRELAFNIRPFVALNEFAEDFHHERIDIPDRHRKSLKLTLSDEIQAMTDCIPVHPINSDPTTCVECGSRTHFNLLRERRQIHCCCNRKCLHEFIADEEMAIA
jgi:hypothetical protein